MTGMTKRFILKGEKPVRTIIQKITLLGDEIKPSAT